MGGWVGGSDIEISLFAPVLPICGAPFPLEPLGREAGVGIILASSDSAGYGLPARKFGGAADAGLPPYPRGAQLSIWHLSDLCNYIKLIRLKLN